MSNSNTNLQTQSSNALHNAIMEAGSKDRPPMLAPGNYVQWKSRIKRYIDTKPNSELIHYSLQNPPYIYQWAEKTVPAAEDQLNAEAEAVQIILTGFNNDIYSTFDACPNVNVQFLLQLQPEWQRFVTLVKQSQELKTVPYHKLYDILKQHHNEVNEIRTERLARTANPLALVAHQQPVYHHQNHPTQNTQYSSTRSQQSTKNRGKEMVTSSAPTYDPELATITEYKEMSKEKKIDKLMALISLSINRGTGYDNQRAVNVDGARENVGTLVVKKSGIQCYNYKEYGHVSREYDTDDKSDDQELEAHYMNMAQIQEVTPDPVDNSGPIFDDEPIHMVQNNNENYNVFAMENEHPEQPESSNDIYLTKQGDTNIIINSLDICYDRAQDDQDETDDLVNIRRLGMSNMHPL
ncbi:hypothetical protein Tco_0150880 [Tanacetum coccineum]